MNTKHPRRIELLIKVKKLIAAADDRTTNALSANVDEFMRRYEPDNNKKNEEN